jgi:hypothetical protein
MDRDIRDHLNEPPIDPRRERLVGYLYEELPPEEAAQVRAWLDEDPALRAEWEELQEARAFLRAPQEGAAPEFVFLNPLARAAAPLSPRRPRFRLSAAWVFAACTLALVGLLLAGLRLDRTPQGLVLHLGEPVPAVPVSISPPPPALPPPVELATANPAVPEIRTTAATPADVVTPDQLRRTAEAMMETVAAILEQREAARREEMGYLFTALYERLREEDTQRYQDLMDQIHGVGLGLLAEQTRTAARLDAIIGTSPASSQSSQPNHDSNDEDATGSPETGRENEKRP